PAPPAPPDGPPAPRDARRAPRVVRARAVAVAVVPRERRATRGARASAPRSSVESAHPEPMAWHGRGLAWPVAPGEVPPTARPAPPRRRQARRGLSSPSSHLASNKSLQLSFVIGSCTRNALSPAPFPLPEFFPSDYSETHGRAK